MNEIFNHLLLYLDIHTLTQTYLIFPYINNIQIIYVCAIINTRYNYISVSISLKRNAYFRQGLAQGLK